ncbi:MAG: hypothetical protein IPK03_04950 [Bacteroidetes bacterium]|nr:hypothetical protein [Bacteroidota bacterium]
MSYCWAPKIRYNTINAVTASFYQMISLTNVSGPGEISYNSITNGGTSTPIALALINNYGETAPFNVYNNFIISTSTSSTYYQMSVTSSSYLNIYHNSFRYTTTLTGNRALFVTNNNGFSSNVRIVNNIFQTTGANVSCIGFSGTNLATTKSILLSATTIITTKVLVQ